MDFNKNKIYWNLVVYKEHNYEIYSVKIFINFYNFSIIKC